MALLNHATAASNHAMQSGGGVYRGIVSNSILYFNSAGNGWSNYFNAVCRYSCTTPDPQSLGNVTNDPRFVDRAAGLYFLQTNSPALDAAAPDGPAQDLAGMPRPVQWLAELLPLTHFLRLIRGVMLRGAGLWELWPDALALLAFSAVMMAGAILRFRTRLD